MSKNTFCNRIQDLRKDVLVKLNVKDPHETIELLNRIEEAGLHYSGVEEKDLLFIHNSECYPDWLKDIKLSQKQICTSPHIYFPHEVLFKTAKVKYAWDFETEEFVIVRGNQELCRSNLSKFNETNITNGYIKYIIEEDCTEEGKKFLLDSGDDIKTLLAWVYKKIIERDYIKPKGKSNILRNLKIKISEGLRDIGIIDSMP